MGQKCPKFDKVISNHNLTSATSNFQLLFYNEFYSELNRLNQKYLYWRDLWKKKQEEGKFAQPIPSHAKYGTVLN